jgi:fused signal recognition particle receptor
MILFRKERYFLNILKKRYTKIISIIKKQGCVMFSFIKEKLQKIYTHFTAKIGAFFSRKVIDEVALKELEIILLASDAGVKTTQAALDMVRATGVTDGEGLFRVLHTLLLQKLAECTFVQKDPEIILLVGINGSGKTTCAAKLASLYKKRGKKVLLVAADTFRAAAVEQLRAWAHTTGIHIFVGNEKQVDPSAVVFGGCQMFLKDKYDLVIIDTAGRLHTKTHLMQELSKVRRVIDKVLPAKEIEVLLTIDSMLGQNSFEQARIFNECIPINGVLLTKMDGTARGGIVFGIVTELQIPVAYISFGESIDSIKLFESRTYVDELLSKVE